MISINCVSYEKDSCKAKSRAMGDIHVLYQHVAAAR